MAKYGFGSSRAVTSAGCRRMTTGMVPRQSSRCSGSFVEADMYLRPGAEPVSDKLQQCLARIVQFTKECVCEPQH